MRIIDKDGNEVSRMAVIGRFFKHQDETTMKFMEGCKPLTEADKDELAIGAAKELGYIVQN